jgi:hypothetical protein
VDAGARRLLLKMLDEAFERKAWHGPNLRGALRGVTAAQAAWRPAPRRHNIWELTVHAAYWKYAVRRRLTGEKRGSFAASGSNWFPRPVPGGAGAWKGDVALLLREHRLLRDVVAGLRVKDIHAATPGSRLSYATLVCGIASHDLYHAGQVSLLKRLCPR